MSLPPTSCFVHDPASLKITHNRFCLRHDISTLTCQKKYLYMPAIWHLRSTWACLRNGKKYLNLPPHGIKYLSLLPTWLKLRNVPRNKVLANIFLSVPHFHSLKYKLCINSWKRFNKIDYFRRVQSLQTQLSSNDYENFSTLFPSMLALFVYREKPFCRI